MFGYFRILSAIPGFFISSAILMGLMGALGPKLGLPNVTYATAMLITITLWLGVAPLVAAGRKWKK
jgi:hypothetical protein